LLIEACKLIDQMEISQQNQDLRQGKPVRDLLSHLSIAGRNGQFRTPRHIIRMMVQMLDPKPRERTLAPGASAGVGDLAAGTGGFLINAHQHTLEKATSARILERDDEGQAHHLIGNGPLPLAVTA
jgi:type I restriction enzyme M protein